MKMVTVNGCCCCGLETGGKIIAWLGMMISALSASIFAVLIIIAHMISCSDIIGNKSFHQAFPSINESDCLFVKITITIAFIVAIIFCLIPFVINFFLLKGIQDRDPGKIIPALVIQAIGTVLYISSEIFSFSGQGLFNAIVGGALSFYITVVLYSLWAKIKEERKLANNVQFSQP